MGIFSNCEPRLLALARRLDVIEDRVGRLDGSLDRVQEGIEALKSRPSPTPEPDSRIDGLVTGLQEASDALRSYADGLEDLDRRMVAITLATAEGIERVERAERRIRSTVKRARKELAEQGFESPALEAEDAELRLVDGDGSEADRVPALRDDVEPPGPPPGFAIPGRWPA